MERNMFYQNVFTGLNECFIKFINVKEWEEEHIMLIRQIHCPEKCVFLGNQVNNSDIIIAALVRHLTEEFIQQFPAMPTF